MLGLVVLVLVEEGEGFWEGGMGVLGIKVERFVIIGKGGRGVGRGGVMGEMVMEEERWGGVGDGKEVEGEGVGVVGGEGEGGGGENGIWGGFGWCVDVLGWRIWVGWWGVRE